MTGDPLSIAMLAPIAGPVSAASNESIEHLVWLLTESLVQRGHHVTLFATGDSETSATLAATYPRGYNDDDGLWDWRFHETLHAARVFERAEGFDVVHSHAYHYALPFGRLVSTPTVHTCHVEINADISTTYAGCPDGLVVTASHSQRRAAGLRGSTVIPHGLDIESFPFTAEPGQYLAFLGAMTPRKGALEAIDAASEVGLPLLLAGPGTAWFVERVWPRVDGEQVRYLGVLDARERNELLAGATALVYPLRGPEPFGLVMVEAMACGTPVAAVDVGAVPEIVNDGVTGVLAQDATSLPEAIRAAMRLDRRRVRDDAAARFSVARMVSEYERLYYAVARRSVTGAV